MTNIWVGSFDDREDGRAMNSLQELFTGGRAPTIFVSGGGLSLFTLKSRNYVRSSCYCGSGS